MNVFTKLALKSKSGCTVLLLLMVALTSLPVQDLLAEDAQDWSRECELMVENKIKSKGITDPQILTSLCRIPRHIFLPDSLRSLAYEDIPLPIGLGLFDPAPSTVARMAELLDLKPTDTILVLGSGSGYLAAIFSLLTAEVDLTEINQDLLYKAMDAFATLKLSNIKVRLRNGMYGWDPPRTFEAIVVNGSVSYIPENIIKLLRVGGRLIMPLGKPYGVQNLILAIKTETSYTIQSFGEVIFPPLTSQALDQSDKNEYRELDEGCPDYSFAYLYPASRRRRTITGYPA